MENKSNAIFIHKVLKAIADSTIKLFIPLYILKVTGSAVLSFAYLSIYSLFVFLFLFIFKKFIQKYGVLAIILHFIPIIITEFIFSFCEINIWIIILTAGLMAITQTLYSVPLNLIFALQDKKINVAKFQVATNIGKLVFTLLSGFLLSSKLKNSFLFLSIISSVIYIVCIIPIWSSYKILKEEYSRLKFEEKHQLKNQKIFSIFHASFGCFQATLDNVVPLFLYINNLSFQAVTILIALIELLKIIVNYFAKYLVKYNKQKLSCIICAMMYMISLIGFVFIKNNIILYILSCICSVSFPLTFVPMFGEFCKQINEENCTIEQTTRRDIDIFSARPIYYGTYFLGMGFYGFFGFGVLCIVIMILCENKIFCKNIKNN